METRTDASRAYSNDNDPFIREAMATLKECCYMLFILEARLKGNGVNRTQTPREREPRIHR